MNRLGPNFFPAFGIDPGETDVASYKKIKFPARAFLGWKIPEKVGDPRGIFDADHVNIIKKFFEKWANGLPLNVAMQDSMLEVHRLFLFGNTPVYHGAADLLFDPQDEESP